MKIIYSCGDVNGIGLEIFFKTLPYFQEHENILVCNENTLKTYYKKLYRIDITKKGEYFELENSSKFKCLECDTNASVNFGLLKEDAGKLSAESINKSLDLVESDEDATFVTLPINKASISLSGWKFQGHTEMIADRFQNDDFNMILSTGKLHLIPLTIHIPLSEVKNVLTESLIRNKISAFNNSLIQDFGIRRPKIAVLSLNPHSGDNGRIGSEEIDFINPTIRDLQTKCSVYGPFAADSFFAFKNYIDYNGIVSMYHDQGLIPIKMLSKGAGVNFTSGLPIVRTSPDHGTAYELAGRNIADHRSLKQAIELAVKIKRNRKK